MPLEKIKPAFVGKIRDQLAAAFPSLVNNAGFTTLGIITKNSPTIAATQADIYRFSLSTSGSASVRPNLDIAVFQHPLGELVRRNLLKAEDFMNFPDVLKGSQAYQDKQQRSLEKACVIAIQSPNGIPPFSRIYVLDGLRHRSLTCAFTNAVTAGKFDLDFASPAVVTKKLEVAIKKYIAVEQGFADARAKAMDTVKDANLFLDGKIGHTVTTSKFNPARGIHNVQVDVKRSGIIGGVAKLFGAVAGTYRMNIEVLKDPYETLLKIGVDKTEILNRDALLQYAEKLKGEDKQDFIDVLKGSPVVKMGSHTSFGTYVERYVIVPNNHPLFPRNEIFGKGLSQVMKDAGPTVAAP